MDKKFEKRNKFLHFLGKWMLIGIIFFVIIQLTAIKVINMFVSDNQKIEITEEYDKDYIGHWYDGTFFINMTVKENFESSKKYEEMIENYKSDKTSKICEVCGSVCALVSVVLIIIAAYKEKKKKLLEGNTPNYIILGGLFLLLYKIIEEIDLFIDVFYWHKYSKGFLSSVSYYPQMHYIFIIPILLIFLGLIYKQIQMKNNKVSSKNNGKIIKVVSIVFTIISLSFILYRFGVRINELFNLKTTNLRLPFYYFIFDLPRSYAKTSTAYTKIAILRLLKDLPVFVASFISVIQLYKIVISYTKSKFALKDNNKRFKLIFISLIISSIILNTLGLLEVNIYHKEFLYQYKEATYTLAIRSLTEPILYGFFIYLFKHYIEMGNIQNKSN